MKATILSVSQQSIIPGNSTEYSIGALIALLILGYLIYSLIKPEKF